MSKARTLRMDGLAVTKMVGKSTPAPVAAAKPKPKPKKSTKSPAPGA